MKKRTAAVDLVKNSENPRAKGVNWYQRLASNDQYYVDEVVDELVANPNASPYVIAESLIQEMKIDRNANTVARTLKEMMKHG